MSGRVFVTGDCHGDFRKFNTKNFPLQKELDKEDYMIICGDFGGIWDINAESFEEKYWLDWLNDKNYTTLFIDGNHENYDRLYAYEKNEWQGGWVHTIRPSVLHLMRGYIFDIADRSFFAMGGASSHDIAGGILNPKDINFKQKRKILNDRNVQYRIKDISWWEQELPSDSEYLVAEDNLKKAGYEIDYIITHCCNTTTQYRFDSAEGYSADALTDYFETVMKKCKYKRWFFGHYHNDMTLPEKQTLLYDRIVEIGARPPLRLWEKGHPKYKLGDNVKFVLSTSNHNTRCEGVIVNVNADGIYGKTEEPCYDINARYEGEYVDFVNVPEHHILYWI